LELWDIFLFVFSQKNQKYKIKAGSMGGQQESMVAGVNEMIRIQREFDPLINHLVNFTVVKFSDVISEFPDQSLLAIPLLTIADYRPSGGTALYDAMGKVIEKYANESHVVCCIATDGGENASRNFNRKKILELVSQAKADRQWKFVYLSEDLDTFQQGNNIGLSNQKGSCYNAVGSKGGLYSMIMSGKCNTIVGAYRGCSSAIHWRS